MSAKKTRIIHGNDFDIDWVLIECKHQKDILYLIDYLVDNFEEFGCPYNISVQIVYADGSEFRISDGFGMFGKYRKKNIHTIIYKRIYMNGYDIMVYGQYRLSENHSCAEPIYPEITWTFTDTNGRPTGLEPYTGTYDQARIHANIYGRRKRMDSITINNGNFQKTVNIIYE